MMMKVAIGATKLARGLSENGHLDGIATYTQQLISQFNPQFITPFVFQSLQSKQFIGSYKSFPASFERSIFQSIITSLPFKGSRAIQREFDIFHATDHYIPKLKDIPVIATIMDPIPLKHPEWVRPRARTLKNWLFKRTAHWADHFITISNFVVDDIVKYFDIPQDKITAIPLGVDEVYFQRISILDKERILNKFGLNPGFFLFVGTLQPRKNIMRIIDAFCSLPLEVQLQHKLVIAGQQGWLCEGVIKKLDYLSSQGTAIWLKYVSSLEKQALLQSAAALVFPSLYEGFGLPVLEAFASDLPVITSHTTSLPEVAGDAALLVDPLSINEISCAMLRVLNDQNFADSLRKKGKIRAQQFTWQKTADKTWQLYEYIVK